MDGDEKSELLRQLVDGYNVNGGAKVRRVAD
jgi:hypothetical protein